VKEKPAIVHASPYTASLHAGSLKVNPEAGKTL